MTVPELLQSAAKTFEERDKTYGSAYKRQGKILTAYFPDGITLKTEDEFCKFALFSMILGKANRWSTAFSNDNQQQDSLHDLAVYAVMLQEIEQSKEKI